MPCHGFAKDQAWRLTEHAAGKDGAKVTVELRDSEKSRAAYPFGFLVRATYQVAGGRLTIVYTVSAGSGNSGPMPFSIGNHLSLRLPFDAGTNPAEMLFESPSSFELMRDSHGLVSRERRPRSFVPPKRMGDFDATMALPQAGYPGAAYARVADPQGLALRITHRPSKTLPEPVVQFNVIGGPRAGYICPEPWYGRQNSLNLDEGLMRLAPGGEWRWTVELQPEAAGGDGRK
jgi:galactose mutarotase-like enzyme